MRRYELIITTMLLVLSLAAASRAQYWFQSGVIAGSSANHNNGASVQIQTVTPQNFSAGSMAFWVGETLSNGAFLQMGYVLENQSGNLTTNCSQSGCASKVPVKAGQAEWFYEYFPSGGGNNFYGDTGASG